LLRLLPARGATAFRRWLRGRAEPFQAAVLNGFGNVLGCNSRVACKVSDRTRDAGDSVEGARGELALRAGMREQPHCLLVEFAKPAHRIAGNFCITAQRHSGKSASLNLTRRDDSAAYTRGAFAAVVAGHVVEGYAGDFDLKIDSVE
jgi:hypothetical protein